jgi:hypothetical protein
VGALHCKTAWRHRLLLAADVRLDSLPHVQFGQQSVVDKSFIFDATRSATSSGAVLASHGIGPCDEGSMSLYYAEHLFFMLAEFLA